ncbi:hypothetical protein SAMD00079811_74710 [Scytonema sp. HK-05]|uniref:hypothetical protein n=1 Tax=Scytonema sp. HK-05 TaxID=1137095 RepID=UPI000937BDB1|nr:hypothetical protein [Scytonema sp. HK-05]BAY49842.1 hypothetical protein SAMD00079811_74710 [Scytonema sp. HK-05]
MSEHEKIQLTKAKVELTKASYPIVCFGLAGIIMVVATVASAIPNSKLSGEKWTAILGVVSSAITAGAGIAQAPRNNGTQDGTSSVAQQHTTTQNENGKVDKDITVAKSTHSD